MEVADYRRMNTFELIDRINETVTWADEEVEPCMRELCDRYGIDFDNYCYDEITVEDIDGDGDGELICKNSVYFPSNDDCIGYTVTTIDYNKDIKGFVVVDTEFVESENGELK